MLDNSNDVLSTNMAVENVTTQSDVKHQKVSDVSNQDEREVDDVGRMKSYLNSHPVIYTGGSFYCYSETHGIWEKFDRKGMESKLFRDFDFADDVSKIKALVGILEYLTLKSEFPSYASNNDNNVLVFRNTAINPMTGKSMKFSSTHYATGFSDFDYNKDAPCPEWHRFINSIFDGYEDAEELKTLLRQLMFISLTKLKGFETMVILTGAGANGKSVILNVLRELVGNHNVSTIKLNELKRKFSLVNLKDKLVNIEFDVDYLSKMDDGVLKSLISNEYVEVEHKYREMISFQPVATFWLATNELPKVANNSLAFYRRLSVLEFKKSFSTEEQDRTLIDTLIMELSGILNWVLSVPKEFISDRKLTVPKSSKKAVERYELDNNFVKLFHKLNLIPVVDAEGYATRRNVYDRYCAFCKRNNFPILNNARFGRELKALGIETHKTTNERFYKIALTEEAEEQS